MKWTIVATVSAAAMAMGCLPERDGPTADDNGAILYWELHTIDTVYDGCSDAPDSPTQIDAPEFQENSFFIYRISEDGSQAITQDCTSTDGGTCSDSDLGIVLTRNRGNTYTWDAPPQQLGAAAAGCTVIGDELWVFTDNGEDGVLDASVTYELQGEGCSAYDQSVAEMSPNGEGVDGCTLTIQAEVDHFDTW